ncbi:hypothetical protein P9112_012114 [Eukaryota sp. TZLM1-RC]
MCISDNETSVCVCHLTQSQLSSGQNPTAFENERESPSPFTLPKFGSKHHPKPNSFGGIPSQSKRHSSANTALTTAKLTQDNLPVKSQEIEALLATMAK